MTSSTVVIPLAILLSLFSLGSCDFATFGQPCYDRIKCDPSADLACEGNLCKCIFPDDMIFESRRQKCVVRLGRSCSPPERSFYDCVENAHCSTDHHGTCTCSSEYYATSNSSCVPLKERDMACSNGNECRKDDYLTCVKGFCGEGNATHGQPCGEDNPCSIKSRLTCINGTCACPQSMVLQDQDCSTRAGASCSGNCVENAWCTTLYPITANPIAGSGGLSSKCICDEKTYPNSEGICTPKKLGGENCTSNEQCLASKKLSCVKGICKVGKASYGDTCGDEVHCDPRIQYSLSCANNSCQCTNRAVYDKATDNCLLRVNQECYYESLGLEVDCVSNAYCDWNYGVCLCNGNAEYYTTAEGFCLPKKKFGESCTGLEEECSQKLALDCVGGVCSCNPKTTVLDIEGNTCVKPAGAVCYKGDACVANSKCKQNRCQCAPGYLKREYGRCGIHYGGKCEGSTLCGVGLACVEGKCECPFPFHQRFDPKRLKCISSVRGPCMEEMNGKTLSWACGPYAECSNSSGLHECQCTEGFVEGRDRMCVGTLGHSCKGSGECDHVSGLICWNGKCSCPTFQKYDKLADKCYGGGKVGAKCTLGEDGACVEGGFCDKFRGSSDESKVGICHCKEPYKPMANRTCSMIK